MVPKIRKARWEDLPQVYNLVIQLKGEQLDEAIFSEKYKGNLADKAVEYWILEVGQNVWGFISIHSNKLLHHDTLVYEIQEFVIDGGQRGKGLGSKLINFIINKFKDQSLELTSNFSRIKARHFYEKHGFICTHNKFVKSSSKNL